MKDNNQIRNEVEMDFRRFFGLLKKRGSCAYRLVKDGKLSGHVMWRLKNDMNISVETLITVMDTVGARNPDEVVDLKINEQCLADRTKG